MRLKPESQQGSFQEECSKALLEAAAGGGSAAWLASKKQFLRKQPRIILADLNLDDADLTGFDFSRCYIVRCDFRRARLQKTSFSQAIIKNCNLYKADLVAANFSDAELAQTNLNKVKYDPKSTNLNFANHVADTSLARPALLRAIDEHRLLADLKRSHCNAWEKLWNLATDYGTSIGRLMLVGVIINLSFGLFYYLVSRADGSYFKPAGGKSFMESLALAIQKFLNSNATIDSENILLTYIFLINTLLGFGLLAIFTALLAKRLIATLK